MPDDGGGGGHPISPSRARSAWGPGEIPTLLNPRNAINAPPVVRHIFGTPFFLSFAERDATCVYPQGVSGSARHTRRRRGWRGSRRWIYRVGREVRSIVAKFGGVGVRGGGARFQICLSLALPFCLWSPERCRLAATFLVHSMLPHQASSRREMVGLLSWVCWSWGEDATRL